MAGLARITGTMLVPGVSLNKRLYTKDQISRTATRMQDRINDPAGLPIVMRTHHDAGDNSLLIVGRVTSVTVNPKTGAAEYGAVLNTSTRAGHDLWQLVKDRKQPLLDSTSIYGWWLGNVRQIEHEGDTVDIGDDLEVDAIDFTGSPGVAGARIRTTSTAEQAGTETTPPPGRHIVTETITAQAVITDTTVPPDDAHEFDEDGLSCLTCLDEAKDPKQPYGPVAYADPGYQKDGKKRYPIDTAAHVRAALAYVAKAKNAAKYTGKQLASIKGRINAAAKKFGIQTASDSTTHADVLGETRFGAVQEWASSGDCCGFSISAFNGPLTVSVSAYDGIAAGDLPVIAKAAMDAACQALCALDPDTDGDFDVPGAPDSDSDMSGEASKNPDDTADDLAGDTVSPDDDMETVHTTASQVFTAEGVTINITTNSPRPDPRQVAAAVARRVNPASPAAETTEPAPEPTAPVTTTPPVPPEGVSSAPAPTNKEQTMPEPTTAPEETTAPPAAAVPAGEDAIKALVTALGPVIETTITQVLDARGITAAPSAETTPAATTPAAENSTATAPDVTALAEAVQAAVAGLPSALANAIKPLIPAPAPAPAPAAETTTTPEPAAETTPAPAAPEMPDPRVVALEAAKLAIPELLNAFGVPPRKGLIPSSEHRGADKPQTPEDLWANRSTLWDQLIPAAPAAVQPSPGQSLTPAGAASPAA